MKTDFVENMWIAVLAFGCLLFIVFTHNVETANIFTTNVNISCTAVREVLCVKHMSSDNNVCDGDAITKDLLYFLSI